MNEKRKWTFLFDLMETLNNRKVNDETAEAVSQKTVNRKSKIYNSFYFTKVNSIKINVGSAKYNAIGHILFCEWNTPNM